MPKMDGITLVSHVNELEEKPIVIVVSGYDDFNYAVEVLRQGVRDYLLKPIEREKLAQILLSIEAEIENVREQEEEITQIGNQQFKYLLLNEGIKEKEIEMIEKKFVSNLPREEYVVCAYNSREFIKIGQDRICLNDVNGYHLILLKIGRAHV